MQVTEYHPAWHHYQLRMVKRDNNMTLSINQSHYALYVIQIQLLLLSAVGSERERGGPSIDMFIANSAVCTVWDSLYCHRGQIASASSECQLHERTQFAGTRCRRFLKPAGTLLYCGRPQTLKAPLLVLRRPGSALGPYFPSLRADDLYGRSLSSLSAYE